MQPSNPLSGVHAYLKSKDKDFTADLPTFEQDMQDDEARQQVYDYLKGQDKEFTASFDEFTTDLGVKKKPIGDVGSTPGAQPASPAGALPEGDTEFRQVPEVGPLGYALPGEPLPAAEQPAEPQLESVVPFAQGTAANPLAANLPTIGTEAEPVEPRAPAPEEAEFLQQLPVFNDGPAVEYGKERVAIPNDYAGAVPAGTYQLKLNGANDLTQYFDRPLSKSIDGKEQSYGDAIKGKVKNALYSMGQGVAEGGQAFANASLMATNPVGFVAGGGTDAGDRASAGIEKAKTPIAPYYSQSFSKHQNWETLGMAAADYAPMVIAQVAQTLAPELRAPAALQKALGLATAVAFDADMYHGAHEHAKEIFPDDPRKADLYTLFEGTLTVAGFKAGSKLMTEVGDKLAYKSSPFSLKRTVATDAANRLAQLEARLGRQATDAEYQQVLHDSLRAALPKLAQIPKEAFQQAGAFGGVEAVKNVGNAVVAPALGGKADNFDAPGEDLLSRVGRAALGGATMGLITGGVGAALPTTQLMGGKAGAEVATVGTGERFDYIPAESNPAAREAQTLRDLQVVSFDKKTGTAVVRGVDAAGKPMQREVSAGRLYAAKVSTPEASGESAKITIPEPAEQPSAPAMPAPLTPEAPTPDTVDVTGQTTPVPPDELPAAPTPGSPVSPEPSPAAPTDETVPPPAAPGERAALPEVQPHPDHVKPLTPQQQAGNDALDALDRYNALDARAKKGKAGSAARVEVNTAAQKAGLTASVKADFSMSVTRDGKRATRYNEYTATTPAANHVPLAERPAEARPFLEKVVATAAQSPEVLQGLGIAVRGKGLSARELSGAVEDIQAGRNTVRAQLVLDTLETAHQRGYVEKSEGTGLSTRKYTVPVEDYVGDAPAARTDVPLSDAELDQLIADDPKVRQAVDDYIRPDGSVDYQKLADEENALPFLFELSDESSTKLANYARERAASPTDRPTGATPATPEAGPERGSEAQGLAGVDAATPGGGAEVAPPRGFTTSKGSEYTYLPDGRTQRLKTATGERYNPQDLTVFVKFADASQEQRFLAGVQRGRSGSSLKTYVVDEQGNRYDHNADVKGKDVRLALVDATTNKVAETAQTSTTPKVGYNAFDQRRFANEKGEPMRETHLGNEVVSIKHDPAPAASATLTLAEQNIAAKQAFADGLAEFRAARKKGGSTAQSSILGVPAFSAEEAAALTKMAKAAIKLGAIKTKQVIARLRAQGLTDDDVTDDQLRPFVKQLLADEGIRQPKPALPANEPDGSATRRSAARILADDAQPEDIKQQIRDTGLDRYEPKSLAETQREVSEYLKDSSSAAAYELAIREDGQMKPDVRNALRIKILQNEGASLTAALDRGDAAAADKALARATTITNALVKSGTEQGRGINAFKLLTALTPDAAVYKVQKEVEAQREQASKKLGKKVGAERKSIAKAKAEALDSALATSAVRQAREKVAGKQATTTKEKIADVKATRASLFDELRALSKQKPTMAMVAVVPITPQQVKAAAIHVKIFRTYIQEGVLRVTSLVERLRREGGAAVVGTDQQLRQQAAAALGDHDEAIRQGTAALGTTLEKIARDHLSDPAAIGKTLAQQFVAEAGLSPADAKTYADAIEQEFAKRIDAARQRRLAELNKRAQATPAKRPKASDLQATQELFTLSPTDDAAILDHLKRVNDLPELTAQDVAELRKLAQAVQKAPEGFQKDEAVEKLLKKQAEIKGVNWAEIGQAMWYANVLSGYKTHVINFTANVIQTGAELGVNTTHSLLTGRGRYAAASGKGLLKGLGRGVREAVSVLTTGRETSREPGKYEVPSILENVRFAGGAANPANYLKLVGRALRAGDVLFSGGLKEMRAYEQAVKFALEDAKSDGTPGQDIWARAAEKLYNTKQRVADARQQAEAEGLKGNDLERRVYELAEQSRGAEIMEDARVYAPRAVFNGEVEGVLGVVSNGIQQATEAVNIKGLKPLKFIVPFTRVITNVANAYLDYTPVGAARAIKGSHFVKEGSATQREFTREERQKLVIKSVVGGAVMAAAFAASGSDKDDERLLEITGAGTGNPSKDAQLRADGWQPYSFKVKDTWYSYASAPIGAMLAVVGNVNDGQKYRGELLSDDDGALNSLYLGAWRAMQFTKDMTALKSATDFLTALSSRNAVDLTNYGQRLAVGTVKGFVPFSSFLTQTAKDAEQVAGAPRKQGRSFGQMLAQDIPVARNGINNALDALGDPLPVDTDRLFSAPPHRDEPTQRIWNWLNKNGLFVSVPNRNSGGALVLKVHEGKEGPMTDAEYYAFMQKRGELLKSAIQNNMQQLERMQPDKAKRWLEKHSAKINKQAKRAVFGPGAVPIGERGQSGED